MVSLAEVVEHPFFVYGTLKNGYWNHDLLLKQTFLGDALTKNNDFCMAMRGVPFVWRVPSGTGCKIYGEVYKVDIFGVMDMDRLENNGNFYNRELVEIEDHGKCWMYLVPSLGTLEDFEYEVGNVLEY